MRSLRVQDVMTRDVVTASPGQPVKPVAQLMHQRNVSAVPIIDEEGRLRGIVSEADLLRIADKPRRSLLEWIIRSGSFVEVERRAEEMTAGDVMTAEVVTVRPETSAREAARTLLEAGVKRLPVVDEAGVLVGIVSRHDLLAPLVRGDEAIQRDVEDAVRWMGGINPALVMVQVEGGMVTIRGEVPRRSDREVLETLICRLDGAIGVRNVLRYEHDDGERREPTGPPPRESARMPRYP
ncbi:MAG TPA: CBS domain-containing protein [Planctomycetota bacterium]|nr:CBS domain-containing protein [Planctomycetota bacterium]